MKSSEYDRKVDFQRLFAALPARYMVIDADENLTILAVSDAHLDLIGARREDVLGQPTEGLFSYEGPDTSNITRFIEGIREVIARGKPVPLPGYRFDMPDRDNPSVMSERYWSSTLYPVFDDESEEVCHVIFRVEEATEFVLRDRFRRRAASRSQPSSVRRTVLIVEPEEETRNFLAATVENQWAAHTATEGEEIFDTLKELRPGVVVLAMSVAVEEGPGFIASVKAAGASQVIVHIEQTDAGLVKRAFEEGADDVMLGPVMAREVLARLQTQFAELELRDVTREKVREQYHQLFMQAPLAIALLEGDDLVYTLSNPAHDELVEHRELIGRPVEEVFPEEAAQPLLDLLRKVYESGEGVHFSESFIQSDAGEGYLNFSYLPLFDEDFSVLGVAAFAFNVTEFVEARMALERESERKDVFLAMLGHELRNPLSPITHATEFLRLTAEMATPKEILETTAIIQRQAELLKRHVNDLLDVARINQGRIKLQRDEARVSDLLTAALESCASDIEQREQRLKVVAPENDAVVSLDSARVVQVVANLVSNASRYTPQQGNIELVASLETGGSDDGAKGLLRFEVRDDGEGIDSELLPHLFDLFTQADVSLDRSRGGLGLGLALVRGIVELHGGTVTAESAGPGTGSCFVVEIPVETCAFDVESPGEEVSPQETVRVLIVDDLEDIALALARLLTAKGVNVKVAHDGESALQVVKEFRPSHIFLDIGLPDMDGYEVARRLRASGEEETVLVALTGYGTPEDVARAKEAGFDHHLVKPAGVNELLDVLQQEQTGR